MASLVLGWLFGPFAPWSLGRKLKLALAACGALLVGFALVYLSNPGLFNGPWTGWALTFGGFAVVLLVVSTWCLTVVHVLGMVRDKVVEVRDGGSATAPVESR